MGGWNSNLSAGFISYPTQPTGVFVGQTYYNSTSNIAYVFNGTSWVMLSGTIGGLTYVGTWNASTNTPTLGNGGAGGSKGDYYVVSVAGSTSIDGITDWQVGDWIVNNGTLWEKVDNSEPPLSTTLSIGNTTGGNDIIYSAGDNSVYSNGGFTNTFGTGALTGNRVITLPNNSGVVALVSDIITLYNANSTIGAGRVATITDTLTFSGGTTIHSYVSGGVTVVSGTGFNPIGFGSLGSLSALYTASQFDSFAGDFITATFPTWQAQIYDNTLFLESANFYLGVTDFSGTDRPYASMYYLNPDGVTFKGFNVNFNGEQLLSQSAGLTETAMNSTDRLLFVNGSGSGTGYMAAATWISIQAQLGINITDDVIPRGTGTGIENGTWQMVGNDIYPTTTGSNIGNATNRIGTIFMASTFNYLNDLTWVSGSTRMTLNTVGELGIGVTPVSATKITVRGTTNDNTAFALKAQKLSGAQLLGIRNDGLAQFNTTSTIIGSVNPLSFVTDDTFTTNTITSSLAVQNTHNPSVSGTGRLTTIYASSRKQGSFNSLEAQGVFSVLTVLGSGNITFARGGVSQLVNNGSGTLTYGFGLSVNSQTTAGVINDFGGIRIRREQTSVGATVANMYGIKIETPSNIGGTVTNTYDFYANINNIGVNNWGLYILGDTKVSHIAGSLAIGTTLSSSSKLTVRGAGNTNATRSVLVESAGGNDRFIINDDGQQAWGIGTNAVPNAQFGHKADVSNYDFGFGFYGTNNATAVMTVQMLGTSDTGITIATQGTKTGTVKGVSSSIISTGNILAYGLEGVARNGSVQSIGVRGNISGGATVVPSGYVAAVEGLAQYNLDAESYGVRGDARFNNAAQVYTEDFVGVYGIATATMGNAASTSKIIGGKFAATGVNTTGDLIALLVPATANSGVVVIGADSVSANASMVEVTGDIEIIGSTEGLILEDRTTGIRYRVYIDNGIISQEAA